MGDEQPRAGSSVKAMELLAPPFAEEDPYRHAAGPAHQRGQSPAPQGPQLVASARASRTSASRAARRPSSTLTNQRSAPPTTKNTEVARIAGRLDPVDRITVAKSIGPSTPPNLSNTP